MFEKRYRRSVSASDLYRLREVVAISETGQNANTYNVGRTISLSHDWKAKVSQVFKREWTIFCNQLSNTNNDILCCRTKMFHCIAQCIRQNRQSLANSELVGLKKKRIFCYQM